LLAAILALPLLPAAALAEDPAQDMSWDNAELITAGKVVFDQRNCNNEFCHGPGGSGNMMGIPPGVKLTDTKWFYSDGSYAGIMKVIAEGIPSSPMEPWGTRLGEEKLRQVAAYVKSLSKGKP
jgi:mono/diheme cytochrome c family protein